MSEIKMHKSPYEPLVIPVKTMTFTVTTTPLNAWQRLIDGSKSHSIQLTEMQLVSNLDNTPTDASDCICKGPRSNPANCPKCCREDEE